MKKFAVLTCAFRSPATEKDNSQKQQFQFTKINKLINAFSQMFPSHFQNLWGADTQLVNDPEVPQIPQMQKQKIHELLINVCYERTSKLT